MMERETFLVKPKHQCHLSQCGKWVYSAQLGKERKLLCKSIFVAIDKWTLALKMMEKEAFLMKSSINVNYPNEKNEFMVPNHEEKGDYYVNPCLS